MRRNQEGKKNNMVVGGWNKELNRLVSSEAVFQTASAAKVSRCLFTRNNESMSRARLWALLQLYSINASQVQDMSSESPGRTDVKSAICAGKLT